MSVIEPAQPAAAVFRHRRGRALTVVRPSPRIAPFTPPPPAPPSKDRDSYGLTALADVTDRSLHAFVARFTAGLSPAALGEAYFDWAIHLGNAPGKRLQLVDKAARKASALRASRALCVPRPAGRVHRAVAPGPALRRRRLA